VQDVEVCPFWGQVLGIFCLPVFIEAGRAGLLCVVYILKGMARRFLFCFFF
jgi:hypothetical protein